MSQSDLSQRKVSTPSGTSPAAAPATATPTPSPSTTTATATSAPPATTTSFVDTAALPANLLKTAVVLSVGAVQGYLLGMAGMFSPYTFRSQMTFDTFILMKVFVSGLGSSMVVQSLLFDTMMPEKWNVVRSYRRVSIGLKRVVSGCLLIGAGMAICGSGPTMVGVQLGMGVGSSWWIMLGFLSGAGVFQLLEPAFGFPLVCWKGEEEKTVLEDFINDAVTVSKEGTLTPAGARGASAKTGKRYLRYRDVALPIGVAMLAAACALEYALPHTEDLKKVGMGWALADSASGASTGAAAASSSTNTAFVSVLPTFLSSLVTACPSASAVLAALPRPPAVLPSMAGAFIGINQISTRLIMSDGQGGSRSLVNIVATATNGLVGRRFKIDSFAKAWQVVHVYGGTLIGGVVALAVMNKWMAESTTTTSSSASLFTAYAAAVGFSPLISVIGGAVVGFGARFAGGCTCGHGVSGASELCVQSLAGAGAIFGGGILAALLLGLKVPSVVA